MLAECWLAGEVCIHDFSIPLGKQVNTLCIRREERIRVNRSTIPEWLPGWAGRHCEPACHPTPRREWT